MLGYAWIMKIAVIGGGAAGMMAAATLNEFHPEVEVLLFERNLALGQKVIISGGGRCNVTTGFSDLRLIEERYPRGGKFLRSAFHAFPPDAVRDWFEAHGVPLKQEKDGRVFPVSNDGRDIVAIFVESGTQILFKAAVEKIEKKTNGFEILCRDGSSHEVDKVILTTGGQAHRHTGSMGDGYAFAEALGHTVTDLAPSLNSFLTQESWPVNLAGVSLLRVGLRVKRPKNLEWTGPIMCTHKGLTGPAVFALSSLVAFENYDKSNPLQIWLNLVPDLSLEEVEAQLEYEFQFHAKKAFRHSISQWVPKSVAGQLCFMLGLGEERSNDQVSLKDRRKMADLIRNLPLNIVGRGVGDEFVTAGGVDTQEVDSKTMESKICPGLYFAGELLNIDGFTGGYNLQASWATGRVAGSLNGEEL
jgi:predicted Rossmann fold flavoprotein